MRQEIMDKENEIQVVEKKMKGIEKQLKQSERTRLDLSHKVWSLLTDCFWFWSDIVILLKPF